MRRSQWIWAVGVALVVFALFFLFHEQAYLTWVYLRGDSPHCPFGRALYAEQHEEVLTAAKDRILAASRLVEKEPTGLELWDTPKGRFWIEEGNQFLLPFHLAEEERNIYSRDGIAVRKGDIVLDCGAHVGVYTRKALEAGAKLVVAIEPAPINLECLRRNLAAEIASAKVIVYPKGVWDKEDVLTLHMSADNTAAASFLYKNEGARDIAQVPLTTIDLLVEELKLPRVDFIKMDIEGAEPNAIRGARETMAQFHPRLALASYHAPDHPEVIPVEVRANWDGYRMVCGPCTIHDGFIRPDVLLFH